MLYYNKAVARRVRLWRNWQTRKTKDLVGDRAGSTPVNRTKTRDTHYGYPLILCHLFFKHKSDDVGKEFEIYDF